MVAVQPDVTDLAERVCDAVAGLCDGAIITPVVGPRRVAFIVRPDRPADVAVLLRGGAHFRWRLRTQDVDIESDDHGVLVSVPNPAPGYLPVTRLGGRGWQVPIGLNRRNEPVGLDLALHPQTLVIGPPQTGKTTLARTIVYGLARQVDAADARLVIITGDQADWRGVERLLHCAAVLSHVEAVPMLRRLRAEVQRREAAGERGPVVVVIIDDMGVMFEHDPSLGQVLLAILKQGRRVGVRVVGMAHTTSKTDLGHFEVGQLVRRRFQTQAADAWSAAMGTGRSGTSATSLGVGEVVSTGDAARPYVVTVARCQPSDLEQLAVRLAGKYAGFEAELMPWLDESPVAARTGAAPVRRPPLSVVRPPQWGEGSAPVRTGAEVVQGGAPVSPLERRYAPEVQLHGGLLPRREPTADDESVILTVWDETGGAVNETQRRLWGTRGSRYLAWLDAVLARHGQTRKDAS